MRTFRNSDVDSNIALKPQRLKTKVDLSKILSDEQMEQVRKHRGHRLPGGLRQHISGLKALHRREQAKVSPQNTGSTSRTSSGSSVGRSSLQSTDFIRISRESGRDPGQVLRDLRSANLLGVPVTIRSDRGDYSITLNENNISGVTGQYTCIYCFYTDEGDVTVTRQ